MVWVPLFLPIRFGAGGVGAGPVPVGRGNQSLFVVPAPSPTVVPHRGGFGKGQKSGPPVVGVVDCSRGGLGGGGLAGDGGFPAECPPGCFHLL